MGKLNQKIYKRKEGSSDYTSYRINNFMNLDDLDFVCPYCKKEYYFFECWHEYFTDEMNKEEKYCVTPCENCLPSAMDDIMTYLDVNKLENLNRICVERV